MTKEVALLISDGGDGSACIRWFSNVDLANAIADSDQYLEIFNLNEDGPETITVPDDWEPDAGWDDDHFSLDEEDE